jgi:predicted amidophosphoribosyltransferase
MVGSTWVYAAVTVLFVAHLLTLVHVFRSRRRAAAGDAGDPRCCEDCGATNEPGYRFCRGCARELPARAGGDDDGSGRGQPH